ncbi:replicative DNA helicase [Solemya elarraichensis gill symbiont]|uniref:Replicative DNA helicase n=1 Tax=Solemya elarraichensis gill symbiont TaxID=1918949 RepID=A0A1T2L0I2_9GAMM|nr:replicative DNA helicase [Solemya elarraichensis gill symbiont]OOZ38609.1 replicative DNA helicase [Solemya elarraichensis gill symbiont]
MTQRTGSNATTTGVRQPPNSIQAERAILGGLMRDIKAWQKVEDLRDDDFYWRENRLIFSAMRAVAFAGNPIDIVTVIVELTENGTLDDAGGQQVIGEIAAQTNSAANIKYYADIVREHSVARQLISTSTNIAEKAYNGGKPDDLIEFAQSELSELAKTGRSKGAAKSTKEILRVVTEQMSRQYEGGEEVGVMTGYHDLDEKTCGLKPGELIIVAGRPSMGKTALAMNIAKRVAEKGKAVMVFSIEMPSTQLIQRLLSDVSTIPLRKIISAELDDDDWTKFTAATSKIAGMPISVDDAGTANIQYIKFSARAQHEKTPLSLIMVDYLQLIEESGSENRANEVGKITRGLKALAKELNVPVIALSQLNRGLEQRSNKRPIMSDLRDSGNIEQDADLILFTYRDEYYNPGNYASQGFAEIIIGKHRNGELGTAFLNFQGDYCRFMPCAGDVPDGYYERKKPAVVRGFDNKTKAADDF